VEVVKFRVFGTFLSVRLTRRPTVFGLCLLNPLSSSIFVNFTTRTFVYILLWFPFLQVNRPVKSTSSPSA